MQFTVKIAVYLIQCVLYCNKSSIDCTYFLVHLTDWRPVFVENPPLHIQRKMYFSRIFSPNFFRFFWKETAVSCILWDCLKLLITFQQLILAPFLLLYKMRSTFCPFLSPKKPPGLCLRALGTEIKRLLQFRRSERWCNRQHWFPSFCIYR